MEEWCCIQEIKQDIARIRETQKDILNQLEWISLHVIPEERVKDEKRG